MMRELGGVFGVAVSAAVFAGTGNGVGVLAAVSGIGATVALVLPGRSRTGESIPVSPVPALEGAGGS